MHLGGFRVNIKIDLYFIYQFIVYKVFINPAYVIISPYMCKYCNILCTWLVKTVGQEYIATLSIIISQ